MKHDLEHHSQRFSAFADQVLAPNVYSMRTPLEIAAFQTAEHLPYSQAISREFSPITLGWRFGPVWSTAWFRLTTRVPTEFHGRSAALVFATGTEALLYHAGVARHGFDANHDAALLPGIAAGGPLTLYVEAACNRPLGATLFWWDETELRGRWAGGQPGCLERCELAVFHEPTWRLWRSFQFARELMLQCADDSERGRRLCDALAACVRRVDERDLDASAPAAQRILDDALRGDGGARSSCIAVGHAHIDTAWLWPIRETRRKCTRTFASVLSLLERFPDFRFSCSQAQQYAWIEERSPEMFERIRDRVRERRWEPVGGMWVEPDANVPSGESLIRQMLHGERYWRAKFGDAAPQRVAFLPDTFGFPASMPQILRLGGLETFVTNKLCWSDANEFPHVHFTWRGIDGTEVLAHQMPGRDYNAVNMPRDLVRGEKNNARLDRTRAGIWLQPFGYGDGGGGPTDWSILHAQIAADCEGLPRVSIGSVTEFADEAHKRREAAQTAGRPWPVWDGDLYLEYHRGVLTSQAWLKQANRQAECGLRVAEWLTFFAPRRAAESDAREAQESLDRAWKTVLLNQFHDILPGSSIEAVYVDAQRDHADVRAVHEGLCAAAANRWSAAADTRGLTQPAMVLNPGSGQRCGVVEFGGKLFHVSDVPALGARVVDLAEPELVEPTAQARAFGSTLANGILEVTLDDRGRIAILRGPGGECLPNAGNFAAAPLNQLVLYDDRPRHWDAWDIDAEHEEKCWPVDSPAESIRILSTGGLRAAIEVTRPLGAASRITQTYALVAGAPRVEIHTRVEWREDRKLLRALFPVHVRARHATYEIQFGAIERPSHRSNPWDRAQFEVCAHGWMDLSQPGCGVALLNDCKYGHSCNGNVMGLTLLKSAKFPDPNADMGVHEFTYALMPHAGDWRAAGVDAAAEALNNPLIVHPLEPDQSGDFRNAWAPFELRQQGPLRIAVAAAKRAHDDNRIILRLVETRGARGNVVVKWNLPVKDVETVDALERPLPSGHALGAEHFRHDRPSASSHVQMRGFQIITLRAQL